HSIWIEPGPADALVVRFGDLRVVHEESPGRLDTLLQSAANGLDENFTATPAAVRLESAWLRLLGARAGQPALFQAQLAVYRAENRPAVLYTYYARWHAGTARPRTPALTLDILPEETPGRFRVFFRGEPVAGVKVYRHGDQHNEEALLTDAGGFVNVPVQPGLNLVTAHHNEALRGYAGGVAHDRIGHLAALSWLQPE
ncbi:MAG TPA: hypothetical protein PLF88_09655, partial [Opitutaceae bacterium]|nr:hypothetical protein [Opitutaceae bacterium]